MIWLTSSKFSTLFQLPLFHARVEGIAYVFAQGPAIGWCDRIVSLPRDSAVARGIAALFKDSVRVGNGEVDDLAGAWNANRGRCKRGELVVERSGRGGEGWEEKGEGNREGTHVWLDLS